jgi:hypothetical protein
MRRFVITLLALMILAPVCLARWPDEWVPPPARANVLLGEFDFETTQACSLEDGVTSVDGTPDCDCSTGDCPLAGSESAELDATSANTKVHWAVGSFPVETSLIVVDMLYMLKAPGTGVANGLLSMRDVVFSRGFMLSGAGPNIGCVAATVGPIADVLISADTSYRVRLGFGYDGAGCTALGLTDADGLGDCCGVWLEADDTGHAWGTTLIDQHDGSATGLQVSGMSIGNVAGRGHHIFDDLAVCNEVPPNGTKCGDTLE